MYCEITELWLCKSGIKWPIKSQTAAAPMRITAHAYVSSKWVWLRAAANRVIADARTIERSHGRAGLATVQRLVPHRQCVYGEPLHLLLLR